MADAYAIFETGGHQYRATQGAKLALQKIIGKKPGDEVTFDRVLTVRGSGDAKVGTPTVKGASVTARIVEEGRGDKIIVYRFIRRSGYKIKKGHRQAYTLVEITGIKD